MGILKKISKLFSALVRRAITTTLFTSRLFLTQRKQKVGSATSLLFINTPLLARSSMQARLTLGHLSSHLLLTLEDQLMSLLSKLATSINTGGLSGPLRRHQRLVAFTVEDIMITSPLEQIQTMMIDLGEPDPLTSHLPKRGLCVNMEGLKDKLKLLRCLAVYTVEHMMTTGFWTQTQTGVLILDIFLILDLEPLWTWTLK
jgi:hypothetical protein